MAKDVNDNEWVWIEVPKSIYTTASSDTDYENIEADLINYVGVYRQGGEEENCNWKDEWYDRYGTIYDGTNEYSKLNYIKSSTTFNNAKTYYGTIYKDAGTTPATSYSSGTTYYAKIADKLTDASGCGLTYNEYQNLYKKMLSSVYTNGGFWIGRYEAGIEGTTGKIVEGDTSITDLARTSSSSRIDSSSSKAISQKDAIPYNYVYCSEAQILASAITPDSTKTSSLMFGIQWDLVCKFLEVKSDLNVADINSGSNSWGNYSNKELIISSANAKKYQSSAWSSISGTKRASSRLLSTGASNTVKMMNIYDLAGNEWEWNLEHALTDFYYPCSMRGGAYSSGAVNRPAASRYYSRYDYCDVGRSFRVALY